MHTASQATVESTRKRPGSVKVTLGFLVFLGITALGGGIEMLLFRDGNQYLPIDLIARVPVVESFLLPGLVLGGFFGIGSLFVAWGVWRRPPVAILEGIESRTGRHWSWTGLVALGIGFTAWMVVEIWALGTPWDPANADNAAIASMLYSIYGSVAVALLILPHLQGVKAYLSR